MRLLNADEIEVKVKQVIASGAVVLLYKTARVDMDVLDETFGPENWESDYKEIKGNLYAGIGVRTANGIMWKWDCGIESRADGDGNEKKGEASDAFKRAGFKWGIGRELYTAPFIFISADALGGVDVKEYNGKKSYYLKNKFLKLHVAKISHFDNGDIDKVAIKDEKGNLVWCNAK